MNNDVSSWPGSDQPDEGNSFEEKISQQQINNSYYQDDSGFTLHTVGVVLFAALIIYCVTNPSYGILAICLAVNVLLHELGHYAAGRAFNCVIRQVSVFFIPAVTFKANSQSPLNPHLNTWRDTNWTIGVLPFGGVTSFMTSPFSWYGDRRNSPYMNHKSAGQRLLIHSAGILVNILTFVVCYIVVSQLPQGTVLSMFIEEIMYLALVLSILNILPFYPLDGSAIILTLYELVTGKEPSKGFMTVFKIVGSVLVVYLFFINTDFINRLLGYVMPY